MPGTLAQLILVRNSGANGAAEQLVPRLRAMKKEQPKRTLTPADERAAKLLKAAWDYRALEREGTDRPLRQENFAATLGPALGKNRPVTQGLVSQYLTGKIALNYKALMAFATELDWPAEDIRNDLPEQQAVEKDPLKNIYGDIKALRFAMSAVVGMISEMRQDEAANVQARINAATEKEPQFRESGYLATLLQLLGAAAQRSATSPAASQPRAASQASKR